MKTFERAPLLTAALALVLCLPSCRKPASDESMPQQPQAAAPSLSAEKLPAGVAARVDGKDIPTSALDELISRRNKGKDLDPSAELRLRKRLLVKLIDDLLIDRELEKKKALVPEAELEAKLLAEVEKNGGREKHLEYIGNLFMNEQEWKTARIRALSLQRLLDRERPVLVSDEAVQQAFDLKKRFPSSDTLEYRYSLIVLNVPQDASREREAQQKSALEKIADRLETTDLTFEEAARTHSNHASKETGGLVDFTPVSRIEKAVRRGLSSLRPGETSEPLRTNDGWALVRLEASRHNVDSDVEATKERLRKHLMTSLKQQRAETFMKELRQQASIEKRLEYR